MRHRPGHPGVRAELPPGHGHAGSSRRGGLRHGPVVGVAAERASVAIGAMLLGAVVPFPLIVILPTNSSCSTLSRSAQQDGNRPSRRWAATLTGAAGRSSRSRRGLSSGRGARCRPDRRPRSQSTRSEDAERVAGVSCQAGGPSSGFAHGCRRDGGALRVRLSAPGSGRARSVRGPRQRLRRARRLSCEDVTWATTRWAGVLAFGSLVDRVRSGGRCGWTRDERGVDAGPHLAARGAGQDAGAL